MQPKKLSGEKTIILKDPDKWEETKGLISKEINLKSAELNLDSEDSDDQNDEHADEKWLLSYADLMTLMFGFFVLMFSLSMGKDLNKNLKNISESATGQNLSNSKDAQKKQSEDPSAALLNAAQASKDVMAEEIETLAVINRELQDKLDSKLKGEGQAAISVEEKQKMLQGKEAEVVMLNSELQKLRDLLKIAEAEKLSIVESVKSKTDKSKNSIEKFNQELQSKNSEVVVLNSELLKLRELLKIAEVEKLKIVASEVTAQEENKELLKKLEKEKALNKDKSSEVVMMTGELQRLRNLLKVAEAEKLTIAANVKNKSNSNKELENRLLKMSSDNQTLRNQLAEAQKIRGDSVKVSLNMDLALKEADKKNSSLASKIADLERKLQAAKDESRKPAGSGTQFMMIVIRWNTEKHDVDLTVQDPNGHKFDFKNRKFSKAPGSFVIDSRIGPGLEMWRASDYIPGVYQVNIKIYNQYGNSKNAEVETMIYTNQGNYELSKSILNTGQKESTLKFRINDKGEVNPI